MNDEAALRGKYALALYEIIQKRRPGEFPRSRAKQADTSGSIVLRIHGPVCAWEAHRAASGGDHVRGFGGANKLRKIEALFASAATLVSPGIPRHHMFWLSSR